MTVEALSCSIAVLRKRLDELARGTLSAHEKMLVSLLLYLIAHLHQDICRRISIAALLTAHSL